MHIIVFLIIAALVVLLIDSHRYGFELTETCDRLADRLEELIDQHNSHAPEESDFDRAVSVQRRRLSLRVISKGNFDE